MVRLAAIQQSAVLPYRFRKDRLELLLVTSTGTKRWILPKGHIEPGLSARESAEFEALEEAGVVGTTGPRSIGTYQYQKRPEKGGERCRVRVFAMAVTRVLKSYPEKSKRKRKWVTCKKALQEIQEPELRALIEQFASSETIPLS